MKNTIKKQLIEEINRRITEDFPNDNLTPLTDEMDNPNTIADYGVVARYVDEELYFMYWDVEKIVMSGEKIVYFSKFAKKLNEASSFDKFKIKFFNGLLSFPLTQMVMVTFSKLIKIPTGLRR